MAVFSMTETDSYTHPSPKKKKKPQIWFKHDQVSAVFKSAGHLIYSLNQITTLCLQLGEYFGGGKETASVGSALSLDIAGYR